MRIVSISNDMFSKCTKPNELLENTNRRPYVVILKLTYKSKKYDFAVPFRSNISGTVEDALYFSLPPTSSTKPHNRAGLHLIKMFPVDKHYFEKFNYNPRTSYDLNRQVIERKEKELVTKCKSYLQRKENGEMIPFSVNIDQIIIDLCL